MALFSRSDELDLHDRISTLQKEISALSRSLSKQGKSAYRDAGHHAGDLYGELSERFVDTLPMIRRGAREVEDVIRENPGRTIAAVGLGAMFVAAAILLSSRR
jgi:hypothetical protein